MFEILSLSALTAVATGLGALPLLLLKKISPHLGALGTALAAGGMIGASLLLIGEAAPINSTTALYGAACGAMVVLAATWLAERHEPVHHQLAANTRNLRTGLILVIIMTVHSAAEGIGIGVAFGEGAATGILISLAMMIHNAFEGLAISIALVATGTSIARAAWISIVTSIPQIVFALPAFLVVTAFKPLLAPGLGFAAGAMLLMCLLDLIPSARKQLNVMQVTTVATMGCAVMLGLELALR
jgi:zinc transporter, ZIP family